MAEDTQDSLKVSYSGFYIGAGKEGSPEPTGVPYFFAIYIFSEF